MRRININSATVEQLTQLAGIGAALAERIVADRKENGPFASKKDLTRVTGISESMVESLINRITLSSTSSEVSGAGAIVPNGQWQEVVLSTAETLRAQHMALEQTRHAAKRRKKGKEPSDNFVPKPIDVDSFFNAELRAIAASGIGVSSEALESVVRVVAKQRGFLKEGRPPVTFLGHLFWRQLKKRGIRTNALQKRFKSILYPHWDPKAVRKGLKEYKRVKKAMRVHPDAALRSTCWGMFQVPGFHYKRLGYDNVYDFVKEQQSSELIQLQDFLRLLQNDKILSHLREDNWKQFARRYFGRGHKQMGIAKKIAKVHKRLTEAIEDGTT